MNTTFLKLFIWFTLQFLQHTGTETITLVELGGGKEEEFDKDGSSQNKSEYFEHEDKLDQRVTSNKFQNESLSRRLLRRYFSGNVSNVLGLKSPSLDKDPESKRNRKRKKEGYVDARLTAPEDSPHSVMIIIKLKSDDVQVCSGSLLALQWVLAAPTCMIGPTREFRYISVYAGGNSYEEFSKGAYSKGGQVRRAGHASCYLHPQFSYNEVVSKYAVALVKTDREFKLSKSVKPVTLSRKAWTHSGYQECTFTGFSRNSIDEDYTRKTHLVKVKAPCDCDLESQPWSNVSKGHWLCAKPQEGEGFCFGDVGGGLLCGEELTAFAAVTFNVEDISTCDLDLAPSKCFQKNSVNIFQSVYPLLGWIHSITVKDPSLKINAYGKTNQSTNVNVDVEVLGFCLTLFLWCSHYSWS